MTAVTGDYSDFKVIGFSENGCFWRGFRVDVRDDLMDMRCYSWGEGVP